MYSIKIKTSEIKTEELLGKYQKQDKILPLYKSREEYNKNRYLRPATINANNHLQKYYSIILISFKVEYEESFLEKFLDSEEYTTKTTRLLKKIRKDIANNLLEIEKLSPNSRFFGDGECVFCCRCERAKGNPCKKPEKMRNSLDSFKLDLKSISKDLFNIEILDKNDLPPKYHQLIFALGIKEGEMDMEEMIKEIPLKKFTFEDLNPRVHKGI